MNFNKQVKSFAMVSVIAGSSLFLQACSEEDVETGLAIVAVAAILASDDSSDDYDRDRNRDHDHRDRDRDHHHHHHHDGHRGDRRDDRRDGPGRRQFALKEVMSESEKVEIIATKYNLSTAAAETLQNALNKAQQKDYSGIDDIGIARSDVQNLYSNKGVSRYTLVNISAAMGITYEEAKIFVSSLQKDIQKAKTLVQN